VGLGVVERACGRSDGMNPVTSCRRDAQRWVRGHGGGEMFYIRLPVRGVGATTVKDRDVVCVGRGSVVWYGRFLYGRSVACTSSKWGSLRVNTYKVKTILITYYTTNWSNVSGSSWFCEVWVNVLGAR
jgi:hypothetical protein